jgi:pyruvate,water dikinase
LRDRTSWARENVRKHGGGRLASVVSREFGLPGIVGTEDATSTLRDGDDVTVCCAEGAEGISLDGFHL